MALVGPSTCWPIMGVSRKQDATSHSTPEAELVAASTSLRTKGLPFIDMWSSIINDQATIHVMEDNDAMIKVMLSGRNPTMRHLGRTHRISVAWLHERFKEPQCQLHYCPTLSQCADIYTKAFENKDKWTHARRLISVMAPNEMSWKAVMKMHDVSRIVADDPTLKRAPGTPKNSEIPNYEDEAELASAPSASAPAMTWCDEPDAKSQPETTSAAFGCAGSSRATVGET